MSLIRLFESRDLTEAERLAGLSLETVSPLARHGRWRRETPHAEALPVLIWIARGHGRITIDARAHGLVAHTAIALPAGTPFALQPGQTTEGVLMRVPELFEAPMPASPRLLRLVDAGTQTELTGLLDHLARPGDLAVPADGRAALGRLVLVSALLEREATRHAPQKTSAGTRLAAAFARAVERDLGQSNVEALAASLGVTPTHLTRTVKAACGMTAAQYAGERVMHEARRRLVDTDAPAANIAAELGFGSPAYFSRAFRRVAGQTPSTFRAAARRTQRG
ncbi:AraC family transcriptional regulator [uncultured Jannaschia sp.]|uniref:helix-turn-helix domain-containing protein n=1 Tax=uncultured Jannaschia sp. TaxID=293347 RepID=UPI002619F10C|nr:AraC family transcriptional regulator [uncultured Jannaschia sp.]